MATKVASSVGRASQEQLLQSLHQYGRGRFHIEYGGYLSNHMAHGLIALHRMGASSSRLFDFAEDYKDHKVFGRPMEPPKREEHFQVSRETWKTDYRGKTTNFLGLVDFFESECDALGVEETLRQYLPSLYPSLQSRAFHTIIQLGYGLAAGARETVVDGLAYLAYGYRPMQGLFPSPSPAECVTTGSTASAESSNSAGDVGSDCGFQLRGEPSEVEEQPMQQGDEETGSYVLPVFSLSAGDVIGLLDRVRQENRLQPLVKHFSTLSPYKERDVGQFQRAMEILGEQRECQEVLAEYFSPLVVMFQPQKRKSVTTPSAAEEVGEVPEAEDLAVFSRQLVDLSLTVYALAEKSDFFLLHGVTSTWALTQTLPFLSPAHRRCAAYRLLYGLVAAYVVQQSPRLRPLKALRVRGTAYSVTQTVEPKRSESEKTHRSGGNAQADTTEGQNTDESFGDLSLLPSWEQIRDRCMQLDREVHDYKLAQVCLDMASDLEQQEKGPSAEARKAQDIFYRTVAARTLEMLPW